MKRGGGGFDFD